MMTARLVVAGIIESDDSLTTKVAYPVVIREAIQFQNLQLPTDTAETLELIEARLSAAIEKYEELTYVPYVWGGTAVGSKKECKACMACLEKTAANKNLAFLADEDNPCKSCESCGIDCSNLVHQVLADANIQFPYLTARDMAKYPGAKLEAKYNLVDVGSDITRAQTGDLIVQRKHVMIFIGMNEGGVEYLHSSRRGEDERPFGGINVVKNRPIESIQKTIVKILRPKQALKTTAARRNFAPQKENLLTSK